MYKWLACFRQPLLIQCVRGPRKCLRLESPLSKQISSSLKACAAYITLCHARGKSKEDDQKQCLKRLSAFMHAQSFLCVSLEMWSEIMNVLKPHRENAHQQFSEVPTDLVAVWFTRPRRACRDGTECTGHMLKVISQLKICTCVPLSSSVPSCRIIHGLITPIFCPGASFGARACVCHWQQVETVPITLITFGAGR